ncbi:MAG: T9SS C-terminal target domain-containing protein [Ignavibacteriales bacterium]|nr:MAG: T9SS C-terminal target domain-containing protein [Ignavibacteriales bacterium]
MILEWDLESRLFEVYSQFITLRVYDMIGREMRTLVNETKSPGTYEIEFDGSDLSSGTYYYKLTMGSHFEIRKMVLLK